VPQSQVLQHELAARQQACRKASQDGNDHFKHDPSNLPETPVRSTISIDDEVFATHNKRNLHGLKHPIQRRGRLHCHRH